MATTPTLYRVIDVPELEVRTTAEGRTIFGWATRYGTPTPIRDSQGTYDETMQAGMFSRSIAERGHKVPLLAVHNSRVMPLGRASLLEDRQQGLWAEFAVSKTTAGDEAIELARDGAVSFSVGFQAVRDAWTGNDRVTRLEAKLLEVSLCALPAYEDALVAGVRSQHPSLPTPQALRMRARIAQIKGTF
jgi:HK97 family phage prohead protease